MRPFLVALFFLASCRRETRHLGNTTPPAGQTLVYANANEPSSLDPYMIVLGSEENIIFSLYEGLTVLNPLTTEPMAGMATHYEVSADGREYRFYLRGHSHPRGIRLPTIDSLPVEFSHGAQSPPDAVPALWSDGSTVTATDFVAAERHSVDPRTGSPQVSDTPAIVNEAEIRAGKLSPAELGVDAPDRFTLRFRLTHPVPWFLTETFTFTPIPGTTDTPRRNAGSLVGNGPFVLEEWRPYEHVKLRRSPTYYERDLVRLDYLTFLPVGAGAAAMNLYLAGNIQALYSDSMPFFLIPALSATPDFRRDSQWGVQLLFLNLHEPPFDNPLVRHAVNMAIDKRALAKYWQSEPAWNPIPEMPGYGRPPKAPVEIQGKNYDVMAYDPAAARELLAAAGYGAGPGKHLAFPLTTASSEAGRQTAEIVRNQLERNLGAEVRVNQMEFALLGDGQRAGTTHGATLIAWTADYADPDSMLDRGMIGSYGGGQDADYFAALEAANKELNPEIRMRKLANCEAMLINAMPVIPVSGYPAFYLTKPYVRGLQENKLGTVSFRYAWIDHNFKEGDRRP